MGRPAGPSFNVGAKIKKWTVVGHTRVARIGGDTREAYVCRCECGREQTIEKSRLKTQAPTQCKSCAMRDIRRRHGARGQTKLAEYPIWASMKSRCFYVLNESFASYGGRGITVCKRWLKFENFYADMGPRPSALYSLERKDNDGNYEKSNCVWATQKTQSNNKRNSHFLTVDGETLTIAGWAERLGTSSTVVAYRISRAGWSVKDACTIPVMRRKAYKKRNKEA